MAISLYTIGSKLKRRPIDGFRLGKTPKAQPFKNKHWLTHRHFSLWKQSTDGQLTDCLSGGDSIVAENTPSLSIFSIKDLQKNCPNFGEFLLFYLSNCGINTLRFVNIATGFATYPEYRLRCLNGCLISSSFSFFGLAPYFPERI